MKLYYAILSTYAQKARLALAEKGIEYQGIGVNLLDPQAHAEYKQLYPIGKVPLLVLDSGEQIPESSIIVEYLDQHYPQSPQLIPSDSESARQTRAMDRMLDLYLTSAIGTLVLDSLGFSPATEQQKQKAREQIEYMYQTLETRLAKHDFIMGESLTLADCSALPALHYAQQACPLGQYFYLTEYAGRMMARPSFQSLLPELVPVMQGVGMVSAQA